jgi:hypothetical protein
MSVSVASEGASSLAWQLWRLVPVSLRGELSLVVVSWVHVSEGCVVVKALWKASAVKSATAVYLVSLCPHREHSLVVIEQVPKAPLATEYEPTSSYLCPMKEQIMPILGVIL